MRARYEGTIGILRVSETRWNFDNFHAHLFGKNELNILNIRVVEQA